MKKLIRLGLLAFITLSFGSVASMYIIYGDFKLAGITAFVAFLSGWKTITMFKCSS